MLMVCVFIFSVSGFCFEGKVAIIKGNVFLLKKFLPTPFLINDSRPVAKGDIIFTQKESEAEIIFKDNSRILIGPLSKIKIGRRQIEHLQGEAWFHFQKQKKRIEIKTSKVVLAILGTIFNVEIEKGALKLAVLEGKVGVRDSWKDSYKVVVKEGRMILVNPAGKVVVQKQVTNRVLERWQKVKKYLMPVSAKKPLKYTSILPTKKLKLARETTTFPEKPLMPVGREERKITPSGIKGDLDGDSHLTLKDLQIMDAHLLKRQMLPSIMIKYADLNSDGTVNRIDRQILNYKVRGLGDLNNDGIVNAEDVKILERAVKADFYAKEYDIDNSGKIDRLDVNALKRIIHLLRQYK